MVRLALKSLRSSAFIYWHFTRLSRVIQNWIIWRLGSNILSIHDLTNNKSVTCINFSLAYTRGFSADITLDIVLLLRTLDWQDSRPEKLLNWETLEAFTCRIQYVGWAFCFHLSPSLMLEITRAPPYDKKKSQECHTTRHWQCTNRFWSALFILGVIPQKHSRDSSFFYHENWTQQHVKQTFIA